jgi:hypothetical protein
VDCFNTTCKEKSFDASEDTHITENEKNKNEQVASEGKEDLPFTSE